MKMFLTIGFAGGLSTMSSFINELFQLNEIANIYYSILYMFITLTFCIVSFFISFYTIKHTYNL